VSDVAPREDPSAAARGHAAVQAVLQQTDEPTKVAKRLGKPKWEGPALPGTYRLKVGVWHQIVSGPGEKVVHARRRFGDLVELDASDAQRLLRAGAVECTTDEQRNFPAAQHKDALTRAQEMQREIGMTAPANEDGTPSPMPTAGSALFNRPG
jgi:hypothetical protein